MQWHAQPDLKEGARVDEGVWTSPAAEYLPEGAIRDARILYVRRAPDSSLPPTRGIVLQLAPTGDEEYTTRLSELAVPLLQHGIASAIMMAPYYGPRRPEGQTKQFIETVSDYQRQSLSVIMESVQLLRWMQAGFTARADEAVKCPLGVTGVSWGGAMAACAAVASRIPVACVPCMGSDSPRCMVAGVIQWQLDWPTLMKEKQHNRAQATKELSSIFTAVTLKTLFDKAPQPKGTIQSLVQVSASSDHFVFPEEGQQLYGTLEKAVVDGGHSELQWVGGGHASSFVNQRNLFVPACIKAFDALPNAGPENVRDQEDIRSCAFSIPSC